MTLMVMVKLLSRLPLSWLRKIGSCLGWLGFYASPSLRRVTEQNIRRAEICATELEIKNFVKVNIAETGKTLAELPYIWHRTRDHVVAKIITVQGRENLEMAVAKKTGIIFITLHLGCFEIIPKFISSYVRITSLFRPPHKKYIANLTAEGRQGNNQFFAPANLLGVRKLITALKNGEAVGILPDQVPKEGEGKWVSFFGHPAYTMTLASKLFNKTQASLIFTFSVRHEKSEGYSLFFEPHKRNSKELTTLDINRKLENIILRHPTQYLWSYKRFKG